MAAPWCGMALPSDVLDFIALSLVPVRWRRGLGADLRAGRPPVDLLEQFVEAAPSRVRRSQARCDSAESVSGATLPELRAQAAKALRSADVVGVEVIVWSDPDYPPALAAIDDPPPALWIRGSRAALSATAVAIVGSRAGSPYALAVAERLAGDLASRGLLVVSGLARGVDSAAHRGALAASGLTAAVLGSGPDVIYPPEHGRLASAIIDTGTLVSELAVGTPPRKHLFPMRNRLISGLSRAVVIVEAGDKSGSLITARCALDQGREVLAVPGSVLGGRNRGGHALIRDGAKIVESADDILEELGLPVAFSARPGRTPAPQADSVLQALADREPADLDAIGDRTGLPAPRLLSRLFDLELQGLVRRLGGGRFVRIDGSC